MSLVQGVPLSVKIDVFLKYVQCDLSVSNSDVSSWIGFWNKEKKIVPWVDTYIMVYTGFCHRSVYWAKTFFSRSGKCQGKFLENVREKSWKMPNYLFFSLPKLHQWSFFFRIYDKRNVSEYGRFIFQGKNTFYQRKVGETSILWQPWITGKTRLDFKV